MRLLVRRPWAWLFVLPSICVFDILSTSKFSFLVYRDRGLSSTAQDAGASQKEFYVRRKHRPVLTIFTSFKPNSNRILAQRNTIFNWASLKPRVQAILFNTSDYLTEDAQRNGWLVEEAPRTNAFGTPYLKEMYREAARLARSPFIGWCNGDILFSSSLVDTLDALLDDLPRHQQMLVIGQRTNADVTEQLFEVDDVQRKARSSSGLFRKDAEDYFFVSQRGSVWDKLIDGLVIGRPGYDNYIVAEAGRMRVTVVDATKTLLALHQRNPEGPQAGWAALDALFNRNVINNFNYASGTTNRAGYETRRAAGGKISLRRRPGTAQGPPRDRPGTAQGPPGDRPGTARGPPGDRPGKLNRNIQSSPRRR